MTDKPNQLLNLVLPVAVLLVLL